MWNHQLEISDSKAQCTVIFVIDEGGIKAGDHKGQANAMLQKLFSLCYRCCGKHTHTTD